MKTLWILRHAKAVPHNADDHTRALAPRGKRDALALGKRLSKKGDHFGIDDVPQLILCSTALRTKQTAAPIDYPTEFRKAIYDASLRTLCEEISSVGDKIDSLMVVGHNPTMHALASKLNGKDLAAYPTCCVSVFSVDSWASLEPAKLLGFFSPPY